MTFKISGFVLCLWKHLRAYSLIRGVGEGFPENPLCRSLAEGLWCLLGNTTALGFTRDSTIIIIIIVLLIILLMMAGPNISSVTGKTIRTVRFGFRTPRILIWFCNFSSQQSRTLFEGPKCLGFVPCIQIKLKAHSLIRGGGGFPCNIKMRFPN